MVCQNTERKGAQFKRIEKVFNSVDYVNGYTVFDIGGNNYRLIAATHFNAQICYIREIWTHAEYSKPYNQANVSKFLNGERSLSKSQIAGLKNASILALIFS